MQPPVSFESPERGLWFLLLETALALRQTTDHTMKRSQLGMTVAEIRTLQYVMRYRSERQVVLSERMGIEPMTLSVYLDRLEAMKLIERKRDRTDRRVKLIEPTDEAGRVVSQFEPALDEICSQMSSGIAPPDLLKLEEALQAVHSNLLQRLRDPGRSAPADAPPLPA